MIRRDFNTQHDPPQWLLISQVEHAHVSGELARRWTAADLSPLEHDGQPLSDVTTGEILMAITQHDDGWAQWELAPQIDPEHGRPYSFMSEMPMAEGLAVWEASIAAARRIGPLAGWMVASHFRELLKSANNDTDVRAADWLATTDARRNAWLRQWQQASNDNTPSLAARALRLLQACDVLSLWLCRECPVAAHETVEHVEPFVLHWPEENVGPYRFTAQSAAAKSSPAADPFAESGWSVTGTAWPFADAELTLAANACLAPVQRYVSSEELLRACRPMTLHWRLMGRP